MEIGSSQSFVIAQGFRRVGNDWGLTGHDGSLRLFAQLQADSDRSEAPLEEAYQALLSSMQPGWTIRWLQVFWPDSLPRNNFIEGVRNWRLAGGDGSELLHQSLLLFIQEFPLPFHRRTILEFLCTHVDENSLLQNTGLAWWNGLPGLLAVYGVIVKPLSMDDIQKLACQIFDPKLE